ncbi:unnamed protein product [Allacma fusca]|uniref:RRM domain-containing protein n=1 Tax=Allacma fusca TaxID=39272 RepID=A0A8J2L2H5_9HEXA|nr:unnamed protein product [Allacma fusca]
MTNHGGGDHSWGWEKEKSHFSFRVPGTQAKEGSFYTLSKGAFGAMEKSIVVVNNEARCIMEKLRKFGEDNGMPISQENGQRCYGPPVDWTGPPPPKGSEVFVGKLPRDIYEPDLVPLFERIGRIYEIRLMMDFSGTNRGYCFVQYTNPEDAQRAIRELNDYEISKGRKIGVLKSVDNCRLFIGGLPKEKTESEILQEISSVTDGVRKVIAYPSAQDKTKNRGFAFVEYDSHKTAAMARRKMIPGKVTLWGQDVCVDWAEPEPEVQNLYVRNLMLNTTEETLRDLFDEVSSNGVEKVKKIKDYAFIHFASREQADAARMALDKTEVEGAIIEINWAKPVDKGSPAKSKSSKQRINSGLRNLPSSPHTPHPGYTDRQTFKQIRGMPTQVVYSPQDLNQMVYYGYVPDMVPLSGFPASKHRQSVTAVEALARLCIDCGWSEPVYETVHVGNGPPALYSCRVYIIQDVNGRRLYLSLPECQLFTSAEASKTAAAEYILPRLQHDISLFRNPATYYMTSLAQPNGFAN